MPKENDNMILENKIANRVIGISIDLHRALGPGLLESAYKECLYHEIKKEGHSVERELEELNDIHLAQILTYLKLGKFRLGLLINFNVLLQKKGIKRIIN